MKVVQVLQPQWLSYIYIIAIVVAGVFADYVSALQLTQPQQEQDQPQKQLQHTEVNFTESESSRFGAEIVVYPVVTLSNNNSNSITVAGETSQQQEQLIGDKLADNKTQERQEEDQKLVPQQQQEQLQQQEKLQQQYSQQQESKQDIQQHQIPTSIEAIDSPNIPPPSPRVVRRLDEPNDPPTQLVAADQYTVPLVKKNRANNKPPTNTSFSNPATPTVLPNKQRQRSSSSRSNTRDSRKSAVAPATATAPRQRSNSFDSHTQSARQPTATFTPQWSSTNAPKSQRRRDDVQRGKAQLQQSTAPPAGRNPSARRSGHKSRQDVSATNKSVSATVKTKPRKSALTYTSTTTPTTTTTVHPQESFNFIPSNPFSFFSPALWALSSPPKPASTKKPPKKYTPTPSVTTTTPAKLKKSSNRKNKVTTTTPAKLKKSSNRKNKVTTTTTTTTTTTPKPTTTKTPIIPIETPIATQAPKKTTTDGPFRIALPTFNFFGAQAAKSNEPNSEKDKRNIVQNLRSQYNCPRENEVRFQLFPKICKKDEDCTVWNRDELCCEIFGAKSCVSGVIKPLEETSHSPILGLIPRKCPARPLAELWWQVQECETDTDCWPRVCCPDGNKRYCRTSQPELETVPVPVKRSFNYLSEYLECTPAPPPIFDLHPKTCESTLDCFPNVCCQEAGLRHCRPPKKSLLTWMANILNVDFVKRLAQNIVIK